MMKHFAVLMPRGKLVIALMPPAESEAFQFRLLDFVPNSHLKRSLFIQIFRFLSPCPIRTAILKIPLALNGYYNRNSFIARIDSSANAASSSDRTNAAADCSSEKRD